MSYTWGYLKENILSKLNIDERQANEQNFLSRFPYYANEAMTQICSSVKPHEVFFEVEILSEGVADKEKSQYLVDELITFPEDFVCFNDGPVYYKANPIYISGIQVTSTDYIEVGDEYVEYVGYNQVRCAKAGIYRIPYNARWFFFTKDTQNDTVITAPADICDAIPSYVVGQCLRIDDEERAAIFRNEYEVFLARIDDTSFRRQRNMHIGGGW